MPLREGETILNGKYRILKLIGEGGMARVWLAEEPKFSNRRVAIKEPKREALTPEDLAEQERRFHQEVEVAAMLERARVPHVIRALTLEELPDGTPLLVMEYAEGGSLAERIADHPDGMPVEGAVQIALDICEALQVFHDLPATPVHRDIKPSNILFDSQGRAYLADFGLCELPGRSGRTQMRGEPHPATPLYAAPEQLQSPEPLTPAADIFALGCVIFEMLTGRVYRRVKPGTAPSGSREEVPAWLDEVIAKALAEDPWDRWQSAAEMVATLEAGPAEAREGTGQRSEKRMRQEDEHRRATAQAQPDAKETDWREANLEVIIPANADQVMELHCWQKEDELGTPTWSPDGKLLAFGGPSGIWLYDAQSLTKVAIFETPSWVESVVFSPDGQFLLAGTRDGKILSEPVDRSNRRRWTNDYKWVVKAHKSRVTGMTLSPDGQMLASASMDATVKLCPWSQSSRREGCAHLLEKHKSGVTSVAFSPNGQRLASGSHDHTVRLWEYSWEQIAFLLGQKRELRGSLEPRSRILGEHFLGLAREGHTDSVTSVAFSPDGKLAASGSLDDTVRLWDVVNGRILHVLEGHTSGVTSVDFSPDGQLLASGSEDNTVRLWDPSTGRALCTLEGHGGVVRSATVRPDGRLLLSDSQDGTVRFWGVKGE